MSLDSLARRGAICLILAWALLGLFGHDPWKPDEAYTFGLVHHMARSADWVVPQLAGEPFMEKPPLFFATAALFDRAASGWLAPYDAARLATALYVLLTLAFAGLAARRLYGAGAGLSCALILTGCLGYVNPAHLLLTDNALVAGIAMAMFGFTLVLERPIVGAFLLGTGTGIAFLSKGLIGPAFVGLAALALPLLQAWRTRRYFLALAGAALALAPWALVWPWLLYRRSPALFHDWLMVNNFGRYFGTAHLGPQLDHWMYLKTLPWFAFPALPLAALALWGAARAGAHPWLEARVQLPLVVAGVMLGVLSLSASSRELYALPMLVPLALVASSGAGRWPASFANGARRASLAIAVCSGGALWTLWLALVLGWPAAVAGWLEAARPGFMPHAAPLAVALAIVATSGSVLLLLRARAPHTAVALPWAAGLMLPWALATTLWLPYLDYGNSYRSMIASLRNALAGSDACVASRALGEPQRALLEYFAGLVTRREYSAGAAQCDALLVQASGAAGEPRHPAGWTLAWTGARPGDAKERYWLFRRADYGISTAAPSSFPARRSARASLARPRG